MQIQKLNKEKILKNSSYKSLYYQIEKKVTRILKEYELPENNFIKAFVSLNLESETGKEIVEKIFTNQPSFCYWPKESDGYKRLSLPNDLDTTSLIFLASLKHIPKRIKIDQINEFVKVLLDNRSRKDRLAPYKTWIFNETNWFNVDLIVNSNICLFFEQIGIKNKDLIQFIENKVRNGQYHSKYYHDTLFNIYCISRIKSLSEDIKRQLILDSQRIEIKSVWHKTLIASIEYNLGRKVDIEEIIKELLSEPIISLSSANIFIEEKRDGETIYSGHVVLPYLLILNTIHSIIQKQESEKCEKEVRMKINRMFSRCGRRVRKILKELFDEKIEKEGIIKQFINISSNNSTLAFNTIIDWWYGLLFDEIYDENIIELLPIIEWLFWYRNRQRTYNFQSMKTRCGFLLSEKANMVNIKNIGGSTYPFCTNFNKDNDFWKIYLKARQMFDDLKDREKYIESSEKIVFELCQKAIDLSKNKTTAKMALGLSARAIFAKLIL